ncbi:MAG: FHA domain-containing protein [Leptolyngbya sp. SIO1E4]|nr:FHA domain-containing protein [Leptolyngbya sp. SIO1E4]
MIICPNCNHQNPDGAVQCEACYTPLPTLASCPSCGASVQSDASFCGQCGFDLRSVKTVSAPAPEEATIPDGDVTFSGESELDDPDQGAINIPDLIAPDPLIVPDLVSEVEAGSSPAAPTPTPAINPLEASSPSSVPVPAGQAQANVAAAGAPVPDSRSESTRIQVNQARLFHVQTNTTLELPPQLTLIHLGKPNDRVPPTIDVSGFPNSEIVSRVHADIRVEGDIYYIEDIGSSNGTYVNNMPLPPGNRHRLRPGDRVALGKGDKVTFIFQSA